MRVIRYIVIIGLTLLALRLGMQTLATCTPSDTGTSGSDTIICDTSNPPTGQVEGGDGDDNIVIESGVNSSSQVAGDNYNSGTTGTGDDFIIVNGTLTDTSLSGDSFNDDGAGDDIIINNGTSDIEMYGDSAGGNGSGNDIIINNGTTYGLIGDTAGGDGSGSDQLVNNGTVNTLVGDTYSGNASGNDTITNNGYVINDIVGDGGMVSSTGNDTIINNGVVDYSIYGDDAYGIGTGNDTINNSGTVNQNIDAGGGNDTVANSGVVNGTIYAGAGDDTVIIQGNGTVNGTMDGGSGYDVLTFSLNSSDPAQLEEWAAQIAAANPAGGTLTINGHIYTWQNFEELSSLLLTLVRLNGYGDPFAVFCSRQGGLDIYRIQGTTGILALHVDAQVISNALEFAQANDVLVRIATGGSLTLYALAGGELQVNATDGTDFAFSYQTRCGDLPSSQPIQVVEEPLETLTIINRPR
jgi:hypothetical protein